MRGGSDPLGHREDLAAPGKGVQGRWGGRGGGADFARQPVGTCKPGRQRGQGEGVASSDGSGVGEPTCPCSCGGQSERML